MNRIAKCAASAAALTLLGAAAPATSIAQADTAMAAQGGGGPFIKPPTFAILPSALSSCVISCPDVAPGVEGKSHTAFNARFQAVIPTSFPWLAFVGGAQWGPADDDDHAPIIFLGGIIPIVPLNNLTGGILGFSLDPLLVATGPGGNGMDFVGEGAVVLNFGQLMMKGMAFWSGLGAFFLLDQNLTPNEDFKGDKDYWNPTLIYGLVIPIAPWPGSSP